jgi:hypothetical protein
MNKPDLSSSSAPLFIDVLSSLSEALADLSDPELLWASSSCGLGDRDLLLAGLGDRDPATDWFLTGLGDREPETRNAVLPIIFQQTNLPVPMIHFTCTWVVRKVSVHFEHLKNRSRGLDVTWHPVRGELTVHP